MLDGNREMAGWHELASDPTNVGGYARRDGSLTPVFNTSQAWAPAQFLGRWRLNQRTWPGTLTLSYRDDSRLSSYERPYYAGLVGTFRPDGSTTDYPLVARVALNGSDIRLSLPVSSSVSVLRLGRMLAHQRGVARAGGAAEITRAPQPHCVATDGLDLAQHQVDRDRERARGLLAQALLQSSEDQAHGDGRRQHDRQQRRQRQRDGQLVPELEPPQQDGALEGWGCVVSQRRVIGSTTRRGSTRWSTGAA